MKCVFIAKHRSIGPAAWLFHASLPRGPSARALADKVLARKVWASFVASARTYGGRRVWKDVSADGG